MRSRELDRERATEQERERERKRETLKGYGDRNTVERHGVKIVTTEQYTYKMEFVWSTMILV